MDKIDYDYCKREGWIINRSGSEFISYKGLIWLAHKKGLISLIATPSFEEHERGFYCFRAVAICEDQHGRRLQFEAEGDASPKNVGGMIVPHVRRMAETRAKARALRDLLGIGMCSVEELGG